MSQAIETGKNELFRSFQSSIEEGVKVILIDSVSPPRSYSNYILADGSTFYLYFVLPVFFFGNTCNSLQSYVNSFIKGLCDVSVVFYFLYCLFSKL